MPPPSPAKESLSHILQVLTQAEAAEEYFLIAQAINLYNRALRQRQTAQWGADDVARLFSICQNLLTVGEVEAEIAQLASNHKRAAQ